MNIIDFITAVKSYLEDEGKSVDCLFFGKFDKFLFYCGIMFERVEERYENRKWNHSAKHW